MTHKFFAFTITILLVIQLPAQPMRQPDGGGPYIIQYHEEDEMTSGQREDIINKLKSNEAALRRQGLLPARYTPLVTGFQWPIKQAPGSNDNGYYCISNYVDEDNSAAILDYNCGTRTYNGHQGTDIVSWPFPWQKMALNIVQIIAAAPGTIIAKYDGNPDTSCAFCTSACNWNAVYVMQSDGSVAWYGHMKTNSLTTKAIGQPVALGEFLGVVGSSGNSTTPHLHFQVYTDNTYSQLVDPWAGTCNFMNGTTSWWASQQPYYISTLNKIMTHSPPPEMPGCKSGEAVNGRINFIDGETVYLASYYRDQQSGQQAIHTIYKPDNSVYFTFSQSFTDYYVASWWYYIVNLPNPAPTGMWRYEVAYNGQTTLSTYFGVNETGYTFTGNGNWDIATNWNNNAIPPATLPAGREILIYPIPAGECVLNTTQTISNGAKITIIAGKKLKIPGNLVIQ